MMKKKGLCNIVLVAAIIVAVACGGLFADPNLPPAEYSDNTNNFALYHLNQTSGTVVVDDNSSGRTALNGKIYGPPSPTWAAGAFGNGLNYANANVCGTRAFIYSVSTLGNAFKVDISFKRDAVNSSAHIFNIPAYFFLTTGNGGDDFVRAGINTSTGFAVAESDLADQNDWNYATVIVDATSGNAQISLYFNGVLAASASGGALSASAGNQPLYFGGRNSSVNDGGTFVGTVDEVRISKYFPPPPPPQSSDLNKDGYVNMLDLREMAREWLTCTDPNRPECMNCAEFIFAESFVDSNTVGLWHMNEGAGGVAYDETSGEYDIMVNAGGGQITWDLNGRFGSCLSYPAGNSSYCRTAVPLPIVNEGNPTVEMTVSMWIKVLDAAPPADGSYIVCVHNGFFSRLIDLGTTTQLEIGFYTDAYGGIWLLPTFAPFGTQRTDGQWHHLAGVYDGHADSQGMANAYLYWDGVLVDSDFVSTEGAPSVGLVTLGTGDVWIGTTAAAPGNPTQAYYGYVDEVSVSNTARSKFFKTPCDE